MNLRLLIPVKPLPEGKQRLAARLSPAQRHALNRHLCLHTFEIACQVLAATDCIVVSRCDEVLTLARAHGMQALREHPPGGLNAALEQASGLARTQGAEAVLSLSCDLPDLSIDDLHALIARAARGRIVLGPDKAGSGTNALLVSPPGAISYHYGPGSHARHRCAARNAGLRFETVDRPGIAEDIDTPEDLATHASGHFCQQKNAAPQRALGQKICSCNTIQPVIQGGW